MGALGERKKNKGTWHVYDFLILFFGGREDEHKRMVKFHSF